MQRGWRWSIISAWGILVGLVLLGWPSAAQEGRFTTLTVEQLAGVRLDLKSSFTGVLPTSGLVLGLGADLWMLGGDVAIRQLPTNLAKNVEVRTVELPPGQGKRLFSETYCYLVTAFVDDKEAIQAPGPVLVTVGSGHGVEFRWQVADEFRGLAALGADAGYRIYRYGPLPADVEPRAEAVDLGQYRRLAEIRLSGPDQVDARFVDDNTLPLGEESPRLNAGGQLSVGGPTSLASTLTVSGLTTLEANLVVLGIAQLGQAAPLARLNLQPLVPPPAPMPPLALSFDASWFGNRVWAWGLQAVPPGIAAVLGVPRAGGPNGQLALIEQFPGWTGVTRLLLEGPAGEITFNLGNPVPPFTPASRGAFAIADVGLGGPPFLDRFALGIGPARTDASLTVGAPSIPAGPNQPAQGAGLGSFVIGDFALGISRLAIAGNVQINLGNQFIPAPPGGIPAQAIPRATGTFTVTDLVSGLANPINRLVLSGATGMAEIGIGVPGLAAVPATPTQPAQPAIGPALGTFTIDDLAMGQPRLQINPIGITLNIGNPGVPAPAVLPGQAPLPPIPLNPGTFVVTDLAEPPMPRLFINTDGAVGLGTGVPLARLHIAALPANPALALPARPADLLLDSTALPAPAAGRSWLFSSTDLGNLKVWDQTDGLLRWQVTGGTGSMNFDIGTPETPGFFMIGDYSVVEPQPPCGAGNPRFGITEEGAVGIGCLPLPGCPAGSLTVFSSLGVGVPAPIGCGNVDIQGFLLVSGDASIGGNLSTARSLEVRGKSTLTDLTANSLTVSGDAAFSRNATVAGNLAVNGQVTADWLAVGEPRDNKNFWSFINPKGGPDLSFGVAEPPALDKLTLTVMEFERATGRVRIPNDLTVGGQLQLGQFPGAPKAIGPGALYFDTVRKLPFFYDGTAWQPLRGPQGPQGDAGPSIAAVALDAQFVPHNQAGSGRAWLASIPGQRDQKLTIELKIPQGPPGPPGAVDFTTADRRYVLKTGDTLIGRLAVPTLTVSTDAEVGRDLTVNRDAYLLGALAVGADAEFMGRLAVAGDAAFGRDATVAGKLTVNGQVAADWLAVGEPKAGTNFWSFVNPDNGPNLAFGVAALPDLSKLTLTVLQFERATGRVTIAKDLAVGGNLTVQGIKYFVQDHPVDPTKVIAYAALEGPEAGTYIRGTARLTNGEVTIKLPESFRLVTSEQGLTVQVTPLEECNGLYVVEKTPERIVVRELMAGRSNARFDYLVQGIRAGHEGFQPIREREEVMGR